MAHIRLLEVDSTSGGVSTAGNNHDSKMKTPTESKKMNVGQKSCRVLAEVRIDLAHYVGQDKLKIEYPLRSVGGSLKTIINVRPHQKISQKDAGTLNSED